MSAHVTGELLLCVSRVNLDTHSRFYDERERLAETIFGDIDEANLRGAIYRHGVEEYGRCTGKVYVDTKSRGTVHVGYVFLQRDTYTDSRGERPDTYLCETWVTVERVVEPTKPTVVESVALS